MSIHDERNHSPWQSYYGPNLGYVQEQYERFLTEPDSVEISLRELFVHFGAPPSVSLGANSNASVKPNPQQAVATAAVSGSIDANMLKKVVAAHQLMLNIRRYGHLAADIDPLGFSPEADTKLLEPETFGLTQADLTAIPASLIWDNAPASISNGWEAITRLREIYTRSAAYEFTHIHDENERNWLHKQAESGSFPAPLSARERSALLERLMEVEYFENFLHRTFVGQKRFSIEGVDMLVPVLDEIVRAVAHDGASNILMGMAHRGRLNVLTHVLGKPYEKIFSEFHHAPNKELIPSEGSMGINYGWTGDVKYHLGADRAVKEGETVRAKLTLANNPSHLEFVNPVVEGFTRAAQEDRSKPGMPEQDLAKAVTICIHGDAAFIGEGIVAETLNFNKLQGYRNGGTLHIIANNRLGFTTNSIDSRSTHYASDLAKGFDIPIVHVNADEPEACLAAVRLACEYRLRFNKGFVIDLIGYRRFGHNEMDDPDVTQPLMYTKVRNHPTVSALYGEQLKGEKAITEEQVEGLRQRTNSKLQAAYDAMKANEGKPRIREEQQLSIVPAIEEARTAVPLETLRDINLELLNRPEGFTEYTKLQRILQRRASALNDGEKVDWAHAETLAFATILADGTPIRLSGQDSERGTFAHRHIMLNDNANAAKFSPLHILPQARASFAVHNSPLSETAVLGFEYGYNVFAPETFVIWEAQYGDFANVAQVIFDQFISAGRAKWSQKSGIVILLPHGYEGQGPEHSSARLERFLQLSADNNWTVANLTTSAQYFHLLRKQASLLGTEHMRPLVLMAPKSLIRNPRVASHGVEFSEGSFKPVLPQFSLTEPKEKKDKVKRLLLCTGKVAVDVEEALASANAEEYEWLRVARVEQLYPFPQAEIERIVKQFDKLEEIVWVQEEPKNMGSWFFMEPRLRALAPKKAAVRYVGRPDRSSTASGHQEVHAAEQKWIITTALNGNPVETSLIRG
ncbi:2-oxoglutarate dehydrogenase E1 component [Paenibacillus alkaliterrae]|uniref:2-oxoglutarate dehydrogenase E1 component n=1 Tax=Paenibacillus alkaliterrae TaxID=320909 RepID=UPI001F1F0C1E|nr:2-oxoglutarate dehydrogenase E1 component [Paenibacillus alkaliterrae]MCF2938620.1 2-oxoglutarate dehydrogenase E1 component [Paenibacillus alkaliterrae]